MLQNKGDRMKKIISKLFGLVLRLFAGQAGKIAADVAAIAPLAFEAVSKVDWNGDGRITAAEEVADLALEHAGTWGRHLVEDAAREVGVDVDKDFTDAERQGLRDTITEIVAHGATPDAKLWYTIAFVGARVAQKWGLSKVPGLADLRALLDSLYRLRGA